MAVVNIQLVNPLVVSIRAERLPHDGDPQVSWDVGVAPEVEEGASGRIVFGTLRAENGNSRASASVAGIMRQLDSDLLDVDEFERQIVHTDALETLYDIARMALRSAAGGIEAGFDIPYEAPAPELSRLMSAADGV